ncbi:MAG: tellurite resistance TerB family protein [Polyangiaceae bacterium]
MSVADQSLLDKVAAKLGQAPTYADSDAAGSILTVAAASYGSRPLGEEVTQPTGFDPQVAALFEAVVESAYLVANADGEFDETEQVAFKQVVVTACRNRVEARQVEALLADLADQLEEDGMDKRVKMVARTIQKEEHAREVLRIASLLAHVSGGVSDEERDVLKKLAGEFKLDDAALELALTEAERVLAD